MMNPRRQFFRGAAALGAAVGATVGAATVPRSALARLPDLLLGEAVATAMGIPMS